MDGITYYGVTYNRRIKKWQVCRVYRKEAP